jgi:5-methylcytosine-specific restriction endonuclease McrA
VIHSFPKERRLRLEDDDYRELRKEILRRDGWKCQECGSMKSLEVHHQRFRSQSGEDTEENLIALCAECHSRAHRAAKCQ